MNTRRSVLMLALLFSATLVIGFLIPATLAYITTQSASLVNTFDAPYFTPDETRVEVRVHKTVHSTGESTIGPEGFQFLLENMDNGESIILTADATGIAGIVLPFSDADIGRAHCYRLTEINDGRPNVVYSDAEYLITIDLSVNQDNEVTASLKLNGTPVESIEVAFINSFISQSLPPHTGDGSHPLLYLTLMLLSGAVVLALTKRSGRAA